VQVGISVALIYGALWNNREAPDIDKYLVPWLEHIRSVGPFASFAVPFSNYTPPYLYLLTGAAQLNLSPLSTVKLLSGFSAAMLALAMWRLMRTVRPDRAVEAGALTLLLPTVIINGPFLGQCDGLWVACCVMSVAFAVERRTLSMAAWAGLGFAIKAQSSFLAPFVLAVIVRERKWAAFVVPPFIYLLAIAPAWMAGWPLGDLLSIYERQYESLSWLSTAPNIWAVPQILVAHPPYWVFLVGYFATVAATILYVWRFREPLLIAALLSAILVPWLLPKVHERYFLLADVLALAAALIDRRAAFILVCVQLGSLFALMAYILVWLPLIIVGSVFMTTALYLLLKMRGSTEAKGVSDRFQWSAPKQSNDATGIVLGPGYQRK
jgi:Gpi18-like mannosyltransferase